MSLKCNNDSKHSSLRIQRGGVPISFEVRGEIFLPHAQSSKIINTARKVRMAWLATLEMLSSNM